MLKQAKENKPSLSHLISHLKVNNKEKNPKGRQRNKTLHLWGAGQESQLHSGKGQRRIQC